MKIGILTYHRAINYGAFLQAAALCRRLNQEPDIKAEIIDFNMQKAVDSYSSKNWSLSRKIVKHKNLRSRKIRRLAFERGYAAIRDLLSEERLVSDSIEDFQKFVYGKYDCIIAGSDEIWRVDSFRGFPTPYWLPGNLGAKKCSYAASSRSDFSELDLKKQSLVREYLQDFQFLSVRDRLTLGEINKTLGNGKRAVLSADPSFLYDFKVNRSRLRSLVKTDKKIIVVMTEDRKLLKSIEKELSKDFCLVALYSPGGRGYQSFMDVDPFEWLDLLSGADFVITSLFHGVCFSMALQIPYLAVGLGLRKAKIEDLLEGTVFEKRLLDSSACTGNWKNAVRDMAALPDISSFVGQARSGFEEYLKMLRKSMSETGRIDI